MHKKNIGEISLKGITWERLQKPGGIPAFAYCRQFFLSTKVIEMVHSVQVRGIIISMFSIYGKIDLADK